MDTLSVSDVAIMLGVNVESVRRWIRDGKLQAERGRGRGGSTLYLSDVIDFVNHSSESYTEELRAWLDSQGIAYEITEVNPSARLPSGLTNGVVGTATGVAGSIAAATMIGSAFAGPIGMVAGGIAASALHKKSNQTRTIISLVDVDSSERDSLRMDTNPISNEEPNVSDGNAFTAEVPLLGDDQHSPNEQDELRSKIVEEQMKLIKLKQELAQIQAQISISEGQIEYYKLLLNK